jgi:hypothetical protein
MSYIRNFATAECLMHSLTDRWKGEVLDSELDSPCGCLIGSAVLHKLTSECGTASR